MDKETALNRMIPPGAHKVGKWREGVIQIWITRMCDKTCYGCTQGSNLRAGSKEDMYITLENFEIAVQSLVGYHGVVGIFGGNPALHHDFDEICEILCKYIPFEQRGLWCNKPFGHGKIMQRVFNPHYSNLNVHLDKVAYEEFKRDWPECNPVGLFEDSRHSPVHGSMLDLKTLPQAKTYHQHFKDLGKNIPSINLPNNEENRWALISNCDINHHWSGLVGQFRGQPRAWFCEVAGAQAMLNQHEKCTSCGGSGDDHPASYNYRNSEDGFCPRCLGTGLYPDTGIPLPQEIPWWGHAMQHYASQVSFHCHRCLVPLRGYGELACSQNGIEQTTKTYLPVFQPKRSNRPVSLVENHNDLLPGKISLSTNYLGNASK